MKFLGFLLLVAGWGIVVTALVLLARETARTIFLLAGIGVELTGMVLVVRAHLERRGEEN